MCVWLWMDSMKIVIIISVPINVLYDNHRCVIVPILQYVYVNCIFYLNNACGISTLYATACS